MSDLAPPSSAGLAVPRTVVALDRSRAAASLPRNPALKNPVVKTAAKTVAPRVRARVLTAEADFMLDPVGGPNANRSTTAALRWSEPGVG